jgi:selenium metabolism protein YedF
MNGKTILIQGETLGRGNDELGNIIMSSFFSKLTESQVKPARLVFWNAGVKLVAEGSWALGLLKKLEAAGVEILTCATCLDFYDITDKVRVGKSTTMPKIIEFMLNTDTICL